jgi:hypothetical protein
MIGFGAIVKSIARTVATAASAAEFRLGLTASVLVGRRRRLVPLPIPARGTRRVR